MLYATTLVAALTASVSAATTGRTFAVNHFYGKGALVEGRMDPLVDPGVASAHAHTIQGGSNFALTMSDTTLLDSTCTSSLIKNDKSVYWTPKMYFQDPTNGSFIEVPLFYMNVYYFFEETDDDIVAFQPGHRIFVGDTSLRTPPASGGQSITVAGTSAGPPQPVQFTCPRSNYDVPSYPTNSDGSSAGIQDPNNKGAGAGFPDMNCDGYASPLRADVHFPSCYNPAAGLDNYKENMAFPTASGNKQNCPTGWVHTPHMFYEVYWNTPLFVDMWEQGQGSQPFVLSNGDKTGYSLHADFISGWDVETLQQIIDNCDAGDSGMDKCPGLIGGINDASTSCNIPEAINENIHGVLDALPGNNPVTGWGVAGSPPAESSAASSVGASSTKPAGSSTSSSTSTDSAVGGGYGYGTSAAASSTGSSGPSMVSPVSTATSAVGGGYGYTSPTTLAVSTTSASNVGQVGSVSASYPAPAASSALASSPGPAASTTPTSSGAASNPSISGWSYTGCYTDKLSSRAIGTSGIQFAYLGQHNVTTSSCVAYCEKAGYSIAGTEYAGQCFCDNSIDSASTTVGQSECSMSCEGQGGSGELCGGSLTLSVYTKSGVSARSHPQFGRIGHHWKRAAHSW